MQKLLPYPEEYHLQGFRDKEISKSKIVDMVCALQRFENFWWRMAASYVCELGFQHDKHTDITDAGVKQKGEQEGGEDESEGKTVTLPLQWQFLLGKEWSKTVPKNKQSLHIISQNKCVRK